MLGGNAGLCTAGSRGRAEPPPRVSILTDKDPPEPGDGAKQPACPALLSPGRWQGLLEASDHPFNDHTRGRAGGKVVEVGDGAQHHLRALRSPLPL